MNVLFLNAWDDVGGAARAALRLLHGLGLAGVSAQMLVKRKRGNDPCVRGPATRLDRTMGLVRPALEHRILRRYPDWNGLSYSAAIFPDGLRHQVSESDPDIVHLHWVGDGFLKIESLGRFGRPLVWTLHDSWVFTGGCHLPLDCTRYRASCGACPTLGSSKEKDLSRLTWYRKSRSWKALDVTFVSPSRWLADRARSSSLLARARVEVIPNPLDIECYRPVDKRVAREALGLPQDKKLILFGGVNSTRDPNKGFHILLRALEKLQSDAVKGAELLIFGAAPGSDHRALPLQITDLGWLHDDVSLALYYAAADVFVFPSVQETLGYAAMEAMACGTPCVAFRQGGVPDLVDHEVNGFLAQPYEPEDFARGIEWVLADQDRHRDLTVRAREKVEREFSLASVARRYVNLYEELLGGRA